jgi:hypothetical protein
VLSGIGAAGWLLVVVALAGRWPFVAAWGLAGLGAEYAVFLRLRTGPIDSRAPFVAAGLVLAAELVYRSVAQFDGRREAALLLAWASRAVALFVGTLVVGEVVLLAAGSVRSGIGLEVLGVAAAVVALAFVARIAASS